MKQIQIRSTAEVVLTVEITDGTDIEKAAKELMEANVVYFSSSPKARITQTDIKNLKFQLSSHSKKR